MTGSWWKRLIVGLVLAVLCLLLIPMAPQGNGQFYQPLLFIGILAGAALALVPGAGMFGRVAGFLFGGLAATLGVLLRAAVYPQTPTGTAMAAATTVLIITIVWVASVGYWPMWSGLLGVMVIEGTIVPRFNFQPTLIADDLVPYVTPAMLCAAVTFIAVLILQLIFGEDRLTLPIEEDVYATGPVAGEAAGQTQSIPAYSAPTSTGPIPPVGGGTTP